MDMRSALHTMDCKALQAKLPALLPDLLLDPTAVPAAATRHLGECAPCRTLVDREQTAHAATLHLLDGWQAPEVSPYFAPRMAALLREEQANPRGGLLARARTWFMLTDLQMKPMVSAAALGLLLAVGGGAYLDLSQQAPAPAPASSATVRDLQSLDENAQVFQQMNSLDAGDAESSSGSSL